MGKSEIVYGLHRSIQGAYQIHVFNNMKYKGCCIKFILKFLHCIFAFRSQKVVVLFLTPEKRKISADIRSECLYGFEVMDFGNSSCG